MDVVNTIRQTLYSWYSEIAVAVDAEQCFEVQDFCLDCNDCNDSYRGVTLPRDFQTVEAMWYDSAPVELWGRWREWQQGMSNPKDCGLDSYVVGNTFPTERDILPNHPRSIIVSPLDAADVGKTILIRGTAIGGAPFEERLELCNMPVKTSQHLMSLNRPGGVVKDVTLGRVVIAEEGGRVLSIYGPDETVPAYTRIKITGLPDGCRHVNIRAARKYVELYEDSDVVESDNKLLWETMARWLKLNRKEGRNREDVTSENAYFAQAKGLLLGDKSREIGKSQQAVLNIVSPRINSHALHGRRRRS